MQNHYSLIYREEEREMFPTLKVRLSAACLYVSRARRSYDINDRTSAWAPSRGPRSAAASSHTR